MIEKDWTTNAGLRAVVLMTSLGHRCGYVGIPPDHKLFGLDYDSTPGFDVHGGLTYARDSENDYPAPASDTWWFGYDCGHAGDKPAEGSELAQYWRMDGEHRTLEYCVAECENLATQLAACAEIVS